MVHAVFFEVEGLKLAVPAERVVEILPAVDLAGIPDAAAYVLGMMNCRGQLLPVIDLAVRLGLRAKAELSPDSHIVVVRLADGPLGCAVDKTAEVRVVPEEAWLPRGQVAPDDVPLDLGLLEGAVREPDGAVAVLELGRVLADGEGRKLSQAGGRGS